MANATSDDAIAVEKFRTYLRIATVHPEPDYTAAVHFLEAYARELGLPHRVLEIVPRHPIVLMTLEGSDPSLPSILLNSHMDVVPVFAEHWKYPPFSAHRDEEGNIYARGTQDMKCVSIQYLEAIRRLRKTPTKFRRTVHLSFVPDEEMPSALSSCIADEEVYTERGMFRFVQTEDFRRLNVGLALDEGIASENETYKMFYGERCICCPGNPGHGSKFIENTAAEKLRKVIDKLLDYREEERKRLAADPSLCLGDVTTVNLTKVDGGVQENVVPQEFHATFDIRVTPKRDLAAFEALLSSWFHEISPDIRFSFSQQGKISTLTPTDDAFEFWPALCGAFQKLHIKVEKEIFTGGTDSRFLRELGIPAYGFSPINNTPVLLHDHNEFLNEKVFLRGIEIYCGVISALANV